MKIVLCTVPQQVDRSRRCEGHPPNMAIVSLSHWMAKFGYSGDYYDIDMLLPTDEEIFNYFKSKQPDIVGMSAVLSTSYRRAKNILKIIRRACPTTWIVLGGNMAVSANVFLRKTEVDICAIGDGEKTWVEILNYISKHGTKKITKELLKIKGIAFLNEQDEMEFTGYGEKIAGYDYPVPDYELLSNGVSSLIRNYFREGEKEIWFSHDKRTYESKRKPKLALLGTTKGCVAKCSFCQRFCKGYHTLDPNRIESHIIELKEKYDAQFIQTCDECFGADKKYGYEIARLFKKHDMLWFCAGIRCTSVTEDDIKFYKECGCTGMKFGVESGSQKILNIMNKGFTVDEIYETLKISYDNGLFAPPSICLGMPGETDDTVTESGQFIGRIAKMMNIPPIDLNFAIFFATPFPGTPLFEYGYLQVAIGNTVDEEEALLLYLSDKSTLKDSFINLTGESRKKVFFWDFLLYYEAMRVFYHDYTKEQANRKRTRLKNENVESLFKKIMRPLPVSVNVLLFTKIPRSLLYPMMRNLCYIRYILRKEKQIPLKKQCKPLTEDNSLRKINQKLRETLPMPKTKTEENQRIIYSCK